MAVFTAAEALKMALRIEENGKEFYNAVADKTEDSETKALFEDLAVQEQAHYNAFNKMLEGVEEAPELPADQYEDYQAYLEAALDQALFTGPEKSLEAAEKAKDRETALRAAMGFEKDTMIFYYDLREMVRESDRDTISNIIREEKTHLRRLAGKV